jgi:PKD domain-containing protein
MSESRSVWPSGAADGYSGSLSAVIRAFWSARDPHRAHGKPGQHERVRPCRAADQPDREPRLGQPAAASHLLALDDGQSITGWTLDYGDNTHTSGTGKPPATLAHTYSAAGSYRATFSVKVGANALIAAFAQVTVGGGTPPVLSMTASPTSGAHPLHVRFSITVNIPGKIVSWELQFGDGQTVAGPGKPPSTVNRTYSRRGTYAAYLLVSQQQQYGGVQYVYPRGGLIISVS